MNLPERIRALAARDIGMHSGDIPDVSASRVGVRAARMVQRGQLHRVRCTPRHVRYYADPALADAMREHLRCQTQGPVSMSAHLTKAEWPADAVATVPAHVQVQHCPGFMPRHFECVVPFVHGFRHA